MSQSPVQAVFGWLLIVAGALWVLLTGGCTLLVLGSAFQGHTDAGSVLPLLAIGLVCVAPGAVTLWLGVRMARRPRPGATLRPTAVDATFD